MGNKKYNVHDEDLIKLKQIKQGLAAANEVTQASKQKLTGWPAVANFLRYNGVIILVFLLVAIFAIGYIKSLITKKTPDCLIVGNTGLYAMQEVANDYAKIFTKYCPDSNKDGTPLASVLDCSYDEKITDPQQINAYVLKFNAQFSIEYTQLFILNYDTLVKMEKESDGDLWVDDLHLKEYNGKALKLNGTVFEEIYKEKNNGIGFNEDIYLCMRKTGKKIAESKRGSAAIIAARKILTELNKEFQ